MKGNTEINGDIYGIGVVKGGTVNQNLILPKQKVPKQLTSKLGKDTIIGREKELDDIDKELEKFKILLVKGIGGVGKSTIASYYLHSEIQENNKLSYYGFFEGIESFISELREPLDLKKEKQEDIFLEALAKLRSLKGEKLLVIDDVKNIEENQEIIERILELKNSGYKILLTSREEIEDITRYELDVLSMDDAKKLFNSIYEVEDEVLLEEILNYLDCHAFFVDMTAKTLKYKITLTPEIIKEKFENGEFSTVKRKRKESFNDYLDDLFSFDELDDEEILMLKQLSVLPSIEIEFEFLQEIFDRKDNEDFEDILNYLCEKGWFSSFENGYKLHQIVKEFIFVNYPPSFEEFERIVKFFINIIQDIHTIEDSLSKKRYLNFLDSILFVMKNYTSENIDDFLLAIGYLNFVLGKYKKAEILHKESSQTIEDILNKDDIQFATTLNQEASTYELYDGNYQKALEFYLKSLKIRVPYFGFFPEKIAVEYNNIGRMYKRINNHDKARDYLHESLNMRIEIFGEKNEATAKAYNVLGSFFQDITKKTKDKKEIEKYSKEACRLYKKSLDIRLEVLPKNHLDIATSYNNLGGYYAEIKNDKNALKYFELLLKIYQTGVEDDANKIAYLYFNIGTLYRKQGKNSQALKFKKYAQKKWKTVLNDGHQHLEMVKNDIYQLKLNRK